MRTKSQTTVQHAIHTEIADCFDHSRKNKTEGENQRGAIMSTAKANERIGCVAKAEENSANFEIQISLRGTCKIGTTKIKNRAEIEE